MKRYCLTLDLKDDEALIDEYEQLHKKIWPEIEHKIKESGILVMEIYRLANRLFMIMETEDDFDLEKKAAADAADPKVQEWENFTWKFQQPLPQAKEGEKWLLMKKIFEL